MKNLNMNKKINHRVKAAAKKMTALMLAAALAVMPVSGLSVLEVQADEALPGMVRSVYTNEWIRRTVCAQTHRGHDADGQDRTALLWHQQCGRAV